MAGVRLLKCGACAALVVVGLVLVETGVQLSGVLYYLHRSSPVSMLSGPARLHDVIRTGNDAKHASAGPSIASGKAEKLPAPCGKIRNPEAKPTPAFEIRLLGPYRFLDNYRNPCWERKDGQVVCLPYYYLIGFPKCGTSDLFSRICTHPLVECSWKENHWLTRRRFKGGDLERSMAAYLSVFPNKKIHQNWTWLNGRPFHPRITGDGTPSTIWDNRHWLLLPGNENCTEPVVGPAQYVRHLTPQARILITMRDPTSRLFSDAFFRRMVSSPEQFHRDAVHSVSVLTSCLQRSSVRSCVQNSSVIRDAKLLIHIGIYYVFIEDWLAVFPRHQILFLRMEDTTSDLRKWMDVVFRFLGIGSPGEDSTAYSQAPKNQGPARGFSMLSSTRRLLDDFYRPFNARLAALLQDPRFLWQRNQSSMA